MMKEKIFYTDGHDVTVTSTDFRVKKARYKLNGIIRHKFLKMNGNRIPGIILFALGAVIVALALLDYFPSSFRIEEGDIFVGSVVLASWVGIAIAMIGVLWIIFGRERYAVQISTAEGEKNVVVSDEKEYVEQIIDALNEACDDIDFRSKRSGKMELA